MTHPLVDAATGDDDLSARATHPWTGLLRRLPSGLGLNLVAPALLYQVLTSHGTSELVALLVAGSLPALDVVATYLRRRRLSVIGLVGLGTVAAGLLVSLALHSPFFLLIRDSLVYAVAGLACWSSLLLPRPATFLLGRAFAARRAPAAGAAYDGQWRDGAFRRRQRRVTAGWGAALVALAVVRALLATLVPPTWFLILGPVLTGLVVGGLVLWTWRSGTRAA